MAFRGTSKWWIDHYGKPCLRSDHVLLEWYPGISTIVHRGTEPIWLAVGAIMLAYNYRVRAADTSSYNCRSITGGSSWSGHAWPVAKDINAKTNPYVRTLTLRTIRWGVETDMPAAMVREIESIMASGIRALKWGGRWRSIKDAMHYQIRVTLGEIAGGVKAPRGFYQGDDEMAWSDIYKKWDAGDIAVMHAKGLFGPATPEALAYWADDVGTWSKEWDHFTVTVLAADPALAGSGGSHDHDIPAGKTEVSP